MRLRSSPVGVVGFVLFVVGLWLGVAVHKGFMILMALGAFGPGVLRQFGLIDDLDEYQKEAATKSGLRAYLAGGMFLMVAVISEGWHRLDVGSELIPAFPVVTVMLVVYYASYCLSFWDARKAVSYVLIAFGMLWLAFVVVSHAGEPASLVMEGLAVPGPFLLAAVLCRWWPRVVGVLLLAASVWTIYFFHMLPWGETDPTEVYQSALMLTLIPLPLAVSGLALLTATPDSEAA
jgi:hypothetical protein